MLISSILLSKIILYSTLLLFIKYHITVILVKNNMPKIGRGYYQSSFLIYEILPRQVPLYAWGEKKARC
jgi:hypothetical protein